MHIYEKKPTKRGMYIGKEVYIYEKCHPYTKRDLPKEAYIHEKKVLCCDIQMEKFIPKRGLYT